MATIYTSKGEAILIDDEDLPLVSKWKWYLNAHGYPYRTVNIANGRRSSLFLHKAVLGLLPGDRVIIDHINRNPLDARKANLRPATAQQNSYNMGAKKSSSTGLKGVDLDARRGLWKCRIRHEGRRIWLGHFETKELAHEFYCLAADMLHGEFACHG